MKTRKVLFPITVPDSCYCDYRDGCCEWLDEEGFCSLFFRYPNQKYNKIKKLEKCLELKWYDEK